MLKGNKTKIKKRINNKTMEKTRTTKKKKAENETKQNKTQAQILYIVT